MEGHSSWRESATAATSDLRNAGLWWILLWFTLRGFEAGELRVSALRACPTSPLDNISFACVVGLWTTESADVTPALGGLGDFRLSPTLIPTSVWAVFNTALALSRWGFLALVGALNIQHLNLSRQVVLFPDSGGWGVSTGNGGLEILCNNLAGEALYRPKMALSRAIERMRLSLIAFSGAWVLFVNSTSLDSNALEVKARELCQRLGQPFSSELMQRLLAVGQTLRDNGFLALSELETLYSTGGFNPLFDPSQFAGVFGRVSTLFTGKMPGEWSLGGGYEIGISLAYEETLASNQQEFSDNSQDAASARCLVQALAGTLPPTSRDGFIYEDPLVDVDDQWNVSGESVRSVWTLTLLSLFIDSLRPLFRHFCKLSTTSEQASSGFNGLWRALHASPLFFEYENRNWVPLSQKKKLTLPVQLADDLFKLEVNDDSLYSHLLRGEQAALALMERDVRDSYDGRPLRKDKRPRSSAAPQN